MNVQEKQRVMSKQKGSVGTVAKVEESGNFIVQWDNGARLAYLSTEQASFIILLGTQYQLNQKEA